MKNSSIPKISFFIFLVCLLAVSCTEKRIETTATGSYFQYEYVNYAWSYNHGGFTVTPSGEIYKFNTTTSWVFAKNGKLSSDDLLKNIAASSKVDTLVNNSDIVYYQQLANLAKTGTLSEAVMQGADMGAMFCKVFVPSNSDPLEVYDEVILRQNGDTEMHNLTPESALIANWLTNIHLK